MNNIPRIRGKVGQIETPKEQKGKWAFTVWITSFGEGEGKVVTTQGPFDTAKQALDELRKCARVVSEFYEKAFTGKVSGQFIDMKTNELRNWEEN
jgi:hypothetical protein